MLINDGKWHRLSIQRTDRKLRFDLDNIEQNHVQLPDGWQTKTNIFIGAELTPAPNGDFTGKIGDVSITNVERSLNLREEDMTDENEEIFKEPTTSASSSTGNEKIFVVVDMKSSSPLTQTIGFLPNDNKELLVQSPSNLPFQSLVFSFRTRSNVSTLVQFDQISLNIDVEGYLALVIRDRQAQRILSNDEQKPINDGNLYTIHLQQIEQNLEAWISRKKNLPAKKISVELPSTTTKLVLDNFLFGARSQFIGCLENVTYNQQVISFKHLPYNRQQCPSSSIVLKSTEVLSINNIFIDQMISFKEYDRPLIVQLDYQEQFRLFSFRFHTQELNSMICSLADQTYEHLLMLSIHQGYLLLTYVDKLKKPMKIFLNNTNLVNDGREHRLVIKMLTKDDLSLEIDGKILMKKIQGNFQIKTIYIGQYDSLIKEQSSEFNGDNFIGCIKDVLYNENSIIKLDHIHHVGRLTNTCQLSKRGREF